MHSIDKYAKIMHWMEDHFIKKWNWSNWTFIGKTKQKPKKQRKLAINFTHYLKTKQTKQKPQKRLQT